MKGERMISTGSQTCPGCDGEGIQTLNTGERKVCSVCAGSGYWYRPANYHRWCPGGVDWFPPMQSTDGFVGEHDPRIRVTYQ